MTSYKSDREIVDSTISYLMNLEKVTNGHLPSLNGYFNKQCLNLVDISPKYKQTVSERLTDNTCLYCGTSYSPSSMKLKLKKKKNITKKQENSKILVITCTKCKKSTSRDSDFKRNINKLKRKTTKTLNEENVSKTPVQKVKKHIMSPLLSMSKQGNSVTSPFCTPDFASNFKGKKKKGKAFSPLASMEQKNSAKKSNGKPSLLSFLTSL